MVDPGFKPRSGQIKKDYKIGICCLFTKHGALRSKSKDRLTWNQDLPHSPVIIYTCINSFKPAHAVTYIKRSHFSYPVIENFT